MSVLTDSQGDGRIGLLDGLMGNASEIEPSKIEADFAQILALGERIEKSYQLIRDLFVFTNKRLILVDKQDLIPFPVFDGTIYPCHT